MGERREGYLIKALCDTSVLVPSGIRKKLVMSAELGLFTPYWSPWIIGELYRVLTYQLMDYQYSKQTISQLSKKMMLLMTPFFDVIDLKPPLPKGWLGKVDPDDIPIWAAAKLEEVNYVVSNNTRDFPPENEGRYVYEGIEYITANNFLKIIGFENDDISKEESVIIEDVHDLDEVSEFEVVDEVTEDDKNIKGAMKIAKEEINNLLKNQKRPF